MKTFWTALLIIPIIFSPALALSTTNLSVPFTSQAPFGDWSEPWQNACEETSILMTDFFYAGKTLDRATARDQILQILSIKNNSFGYSLDETADTVVNLINGYLPWEAYLVSNPTLEQIKNEIDQGHPVILPFYSRDLLNPHFLQGGPEYHMNVVSGYDDNAQKFIVQEPGTRFGLDYRYSYNIILHAIHDFLPGNTINGSKIAIFTRKNLQTSSNTDADQDGLTKSDELKYGTILWLKDSDGDGYLDGEEVTSGHSPTMAETRLTNGALIKTADDSRVYLLENNTKRHILNESVFLSHGWAWSDIVVMSEVFLDNLPNKSQVFD
ncbi:C39 family peptidase [Patescibacteria group bacterium]|nr:C39 family peptidase [Patescibacteria group bacterium]